MRVELSTGPSRHRNLSLVPGRVYRQLWSVYKTFSFCRVLNLTEVGLGLVSKTKPCASFCALLIRAIGCGKAGVCVGGECDPRAMWRPHIRTCHELTRDVDGLRRTPPPGKTSILCEFDGSGAVSQILCVLSFLLLPSFSFCWAQIISAELVSPISIYLALFK